MIRVVGNDRTVAFAAEELQRYLTLATGRKPDIRFSAYSRRQDGLWLGTAEFWNRDERYDEMVEDYYTSAFGPRGMEAQVGNS